MLGIVLIIVAAIFGFLAALSWVVFAWSLDAGQRQEYVLLTFYHSYRLPVVLVTVAAMFLAGCAGVWYQILSRRQQPILVTVQGQEGESFDKATTASLRRELQEAAAEKVKEAEDYFNAGERDYAASRYRDAAVNYQKSVEVIPSMSGFLNLGNAHFNISSFDSSIEAFSNGLTIAHSKKSAVFEGSFLNNLALVYRDKGKLQEALEVLQTAFKLFTDTNNLFGQAQCLNSAGQVYLQLGNLEEASSNFQKGLQLSKKNRFSLVQANILGNIGNLCRHQNRIEDAIEAYQNALKLFKTLGNLRGQANSLMSIGVTYRIQDSFEESLEYLQQSFQLQSKLDNLLGKANVLMNMGNVYFSAGDLGKALEPVSKVPKYVGWKVGVPRATFAKLEG